MRTIDNVELNKIENFVFEYSYQEDLTDSLDELDSDFTQEIINEIVLWKVNRYALIDPNTLSFLNRISKNDKILDVDLTKKILKGLLKCKGVRLAMASTILRFKNPNIYQIIDQRVYRFIAGKELKYSLTEIDEQIELYLQYLNDLRESCSKYNLRFENADRIIYEMDKKFNSEIKIKY